MPANPAADNKFKHEAVTMVLSVISFIAVWKLNQSNKDNSMNTPMVENGFRELGKLLSDINVLKVRTCLCILNRLYIGIIKLRPCQTG